VLTVEIMMIKDMAQEFVGATSAKGASVRLMLLGLGAAIYATSFTLPAVAIGYYGSDYLRGWECARIALTAFRNSREPSSLILFACGLINPLTLAYLALRMLGKGPRVRRALAIAALSFIPLSWYVIADGLRIEIGHVAWVVGLLLMMAPEAIGIVRTPR
jgi:hypothetical protein